MAKESMLSHVVETRNPADQFGYPDSALVIEFQNNGNRIHLIFDDQALPSTNFNNAPNGSIFIPFTVTGGELKPSIKFGAKGGIAGTWAAAPVAFA